MEVRKVNAIVRTMLGAPRTPHRPVMPVERVWRVRTRCEATPGDLQ